MFKVGDKIKTKDNDFGLPSGLVGIIGAEHQGISYVIWHNNPDYHDNRYTSTDSDYQYCWCTNKTSIQNNCERLIEFKNIEKII